MRSFCTFLWIALSVPCLPQSPAPRGECTLIIHVTGVRNTKGGVGGLLFTSTDGWPEDRDKAVARGTFPIADGKSTLKFDNLAAGAYGVVVLHDENENKKLDRNFIRIPKEGFGFANNPKVALTPPKLPVATVKVSGPVTEIQIQMIYK